MSFPASLQLITLTGTFLDGDGDPRQGVVTITLPTPIRSEGDNVIVPPFELETDLDLNGSFDIDVPATTDPQWLPNNASYLIQAVFIEDFRKLWWSIPLPYDSAGGTVDLADVGAPNVGTPSYSIRQGTTQPLADGGYKGTWGVGTLYRSGDTVQHSTSVYGALRASSGVTPGTNAAIWKVFPSSGGGGGAVDSVFGRTGDVIAEAGDYTKAQIGLGSVDNTADTAKPVSVAQAAANALVASNAASALSAHEADTTNVHGIADTSVLATLTDVSGRQPLDSDLTTIAGLTATTDNVIQSVASAWASRTPAQLKATLALAKGDVGLGNVDNTSDANKPVSTATQTALDGKQTLDSDLTSIAGLTPTNDDLIQRKAGVWTNRTPAQVKTDLVLVKADVGLGNVDNTSDAAKPISTLTQAALDAKADLSGGKVPIAQIPTGSTGSTVPFGNDARFSDTRTPTDGTVTTAKIVDSNVTLAKLANIAAASILGNNTGGAVAPLALTAAQTKTLLAIAESDVTGLVSDLAGKQPLDSDLTTIAGLTATTDNFLVSVASAWASRTPAQVKTTLAIAQADVSGLVAALALLAPLANPALTGTATAVNLTQSGRYLSTPDTLTDAATIAVDASLGNDFTVTLGGNRTLGNPTNSVNGQKIMFAIRQDGTGTRTLTLGTDYRLGADITAVTLSTAVNKTDYLGVRYNSTDSKWDVIAFVKGY